MNVSQIGELMGSKKDLYNILELENIVNGKKISLTDLYEHELHLKRLKLNFPKKLKQSERAYAEDISEILSSISKVIEEIEINNIGLSHEKN